MPDRVFVEVPPGFRRMVEELTDLAILILDQLDGDSDFEPSLAGCPFDGGQDLEAEDEREPDEASVFLPLRQKP